MNSLFSFARHKSSIINSPVPIILLLLLCCIAGCRGGHPAEKEEADDLQQIKDSGELVVLTLYSSTSYFIYRQKFLKIAKINSIMTNISFFLYLDRKSVV